MTWYCHECAYGNSNANGTCQGTNGPCKHNKCGSCAESEDTNGNAMYSCCRCGARYYITSGRTMCRTSHGFRCTHAKCGSCTTS